MKIFKERLSKFRKVFLLVIVASTLLTIDFGCIKNYVNAKSSQTMTMTLIYSGAEKGLNPDGSIFNMSEIVSPEVIDNAVEKLNKQGITITSEELSEQLRTSSVMSDTVLDSAKAAINNNQAYQSLPNTFHITYENSGNLITKLFSKNDTVTILNAVADAYTEYFQKYHMEKTTVLEYTPVTLEDYDYLEVSDVVSRKISSMRSYLSEKKNADSTFTSTTTGYSFADLYEMLTNITNLDLDSLTASIKENSLSLDSTSLYNKLVTLRDEKTRDLQDVLNSQYVSEQAVKDYEAKITASVFIPTDDSSNNYYMSKTKNGADYLIENAYDYSLKATALAKSISEYEQLMGVFNTSTDINDEIYETANNLITVINSELEELSELAIQTTNDYIEQSTKGYISFDIPHDDYMKTAITFKTIVKYGIVGFILGLCVCAVVYAKRDGIKQYQNKKKIRNIQKWMNEELSEEKSTQTKSFDLENIKSTHTKNYVDITVWDIFSWLWKWKLLIIVACMLCTTCGYMYANKIQTYSATAYIKYEDQSVAEGMNPDYDDFDKDEIIAPSVITQAIKNIGLNVSTDAVRSAIRVSSITPTYISTIKDTKIESGEEYTYYPIYFSVTITGNDTLGLTPSQLRNLLDAVLNEYVNTYTTDYINKATIEAVNFDTNKYDYLESADLISDNIDSVMESLQAYNDTNSSYRSPATGYSFSDLINMYQNIDTISLPRLYSLILNNKLSKNSSLLIDTYSNKNKQHTISRESSERQVEEDERLIDELVEVSEEIMNSTTSNGFESDEDNRIVDDTDNYTRRSTPLITYDNLLNKWVDDSINAGSEKLQAERCADIVTLYADGVNADTLGADYIDEATDKNVDTEVNNILDEIHELYELSSETLDDYNNYIAAQHITYVTGIKTYANVSRLMYMALGLGLSMMVSIVGCITYEIIKKAKRGRR